MITPKWVKGISPAPRPSEGQGERLERGGNGRPFFGILSASFVASGARDPRTHGVQGLSVWGGGLLRAPSQALFTLHVFSRPRFFFLFFLFLLGPWGPVGLLAARCLIDDYIAECFPRVAPRISRNYPREDVAPPPKPRPLYGFFDVMEGEILAMFFMVFFLETVPLHFAVFRSSIRLRFFSESFWQRALNGESGVWLGDVFWPKNAPFCVPKTAKKKFSLT